VPFLSVVAVDVWPPSLKSTVWPLRAPAVEVKRKLAFKVIELPAVSLREPDRATDVAWEVTLTNCCCLLSRTAS
jgi:hypothetical protein